MPRKPTIGDILMQAISPPAENINYHQIGWRLSYNPYCMDTDSDETAICLGSGKSEKFLILYGNHVDYLKGKSRDEAVAYWQSKPELHGATSDKIEDKSDV